MELNDWSTHLIQAQVQLKGIEHKLLHKDYEGIEDHIAAAKLALDKTQAWVVLKGSNANVDVAPILQRVLDATPDGDMLRPYIVAALQEIKQLRNERKFWLKSGYEIGAKQ